MTIYVDVLIILNIYVNSFLLLITARLTSSPLKPLRCFIASFYGSFFSLLILVPELPAAVNIIIKLAAAVTVVMAAFGIHGKSRLLKNSAAFFAANFILAGGVNAVYSWLKPSFMHFSNSYFYIDFSLLILVVTTALLYFIISLIKRFAGNSPDTSYSVVIRLKGKIYRIEGLSDTGNSLTDFFSGKPVIVCSKENFDDIPQDTRFRLIPAETVSGSGLINIFRPDEVLVINEKNGSRKPVDVMIGLGESRKKAIFNPKILR